MNAQPATTEEASSPEIPAVTLAGGDHTDHLLHPDSPPDGGAQYDRVAFYGRTYGEYERYFNFQGEAWSGRRVLDCHGRASSFTCDAVRGGIRAISLDPMYDQRTEILDYIGRADMEEVMRKSMERPELYNFDYIKSFDQVRALREEALKRFLADFTAGRAQGRYVTGQLPNLPFNDNSFDFVLNNHHLFLYGDHFEYGMILESCREMVRVCDLNRGGEVRIYPLLGHSTRPYRHLQKLRIDLFREYEISAEVVEIPFQYLKGSNQMLILHRR